VGDLVLVKNHEPFPADMIVVGTASKDGLCYIETSNIDGETNLKIRERVNGINTSEDQELRGHMEWEAPNRSIYTFSGSFTAAESVFPLSEQNLLPRGSILRNTPWVHGLVVYTGPETKIMMNASPTPSKLSMVERTVNQMLWLVLFCLAVLSTMSVICLELQKAGNWSPYGNSTAGSGAWYLVSPNSQSYAIPDPLAYWFTFIVLYSNFVPISLYVTMEMVNVLQVIQSNRRNVHDDSSVSCARC
jgi:phospholipid-transporting ATPase